MLSYFKNRRDLKSRIRQIEEETGDKKWYYYIDFGYGVKVGKEHRRDKTGGYRNWENFLVDSLPALKGLRVLDIGCNAGIYDLEMVKIGALEVIGIDLDTRKAEFIREWFEQKDGKKYDRVKFISGDVGHYDFLSLGQFDLVCMFCVAYHLGEYIENIFHQLQKMTSTVALQGNLPRLISPKYRNRKYQELAGTEGMAALLEAYGFNNIDVKAPQGYAKPLIIGKK